MKNSFFAFALLLVSTFSFAQKDSTSNVYFSGGGNGMMLSMSSVKNAAGSSVGSIPRFTVFFNLGTNVNYDVNRNFGLFSGVNLTNVGMITEDGNVKLKQRVYAVGIPIGIKVGDLKKFFVYAGAEAAFAINYKEKRFVDGKKTGKFNEWFSERSNTFMPSVFAGFQTKNGFGLKVQYYLNDFLNQSFSQDGFKPYTGVQSQLFFVSLGYSFSRKSDKYDANGKKGTSINNF